MSTDPDMKRLAMNFHPAEYIVEELVKRGWTTAQLIAEGVGDQIDLLALEMFICNGGDKNLTLDVDTIDTIARGFGTSPDLWRNLQTRWLDNPLDAEPFDVPEQILSGNGSKQDRSPEDV